MAATRMSCPEQQQQRSLQTYPQAEEAGLEGGLEGQHQLPLLFLPHVDIAESDQHKWPGYEVRVRQGGRGACLALVAIESAQDAAHAVAHVAQRHLGSCSIRGLHVPKEAGLLHR